MKICFTTSLVILKASNSFFKANILSFLCLYSTQLINLAHPIVMFTMEKIAYPKLGYLSQNLSWANPFKAIKLSKQWPNGQKIAQSGHPEWQPTWTQSMATVGVSAIMMRRMELATLRSVSSSWNLTTSSVNSENGKGRQRILKACLHEIGFDRDAR
jgi:hypothetical protein